MTFVITSSDTERLLDLLAYGLATGSIEALRQVEDDPEMLEETA